MSNKNPNKDSSTKMDDLSEGQIVIVTARWILVVAGLILTLWDPSEIGDLRVQVMVLLLMAVGNFYLHMQTLTRRAIPLSIIYAASAFDLLAVTAFVLVGDGFNSSLYIYYYPAVLALSVAFPRAMTGVFVFGTGWFYGLVCLVSIGSSITNDQAQIVFARVAMLAAVAVCGSLYQQIETGRREAMAVGRIKDAVPVGMPAPIES